ncbi:UNVERIFIED_ORG: ankyrin repeat protein [Comamonas terrigena]
MASGGGDWKDMYKAAEHGDAACVRYHLSAGVDVDYQHPEVMQTALVASLLQGHAEVARLLLEHGADPNLPAELGSLSPLQAAQSRGHAALLPLLQAHGAVARPAPAPVWWQRWLPL